MTTPNLLAGVALNTPQKSYTLHPHLETGIQFIRDGWLSGRGSVILLPDLAWRKKYPNKITQEKAVFDLPRIALDWRPMREERDALARELHCLLTEHALLSNPSFITDHEAPRLKGAQQALSALRRWYRSLLESNRYTYLLCEECKARSQKEHYHRSNMPWPGKVVEQLCPHTEILIPSIIALCQRFPELMFELLGLLSPEWDHGQHKHIPYRFSLTPEAFAYAMLSQLDANSPVHFPRYETHVYDTYHSIRMTPSVSYKNTEQHSKERQEKVACSAFAWGITSSIKHLFKKPLEEVAYPTLGTKNLEPLPTPLPEISSLEAAEQRAEILQRLLHNGPSLQDFIKKLQYLTNEQRNLLHAIPMRQLADECLEIEEQLAEDLE
jgi:hypothetical protein